MTEVVATDASVGALALSRVVMSHRGLRDVAGVEYSGRADDQLPDEFASLPLDDLLAVITKVGLLGATSPASDAPVGSNRKARSGATLRADLTVAESAWMMDAAYRIISDWPSSVGALFSFLADRNVNADVDHPVRRIFATETGYLLLSALKSLDGASIKVIDDALEDWLRRERGIYIDGRNRAKIASDGDIAIDLADALRRLEGRKTSSWGMDSWVDAGAAIKIGERVSLASVERTVQAMGRLTSHRLDDAITVEEWSLGKHFHPRYHRSDAIRDILSGAIRVEFGAKSNGHGLAAFRISREDLRRRAVSQRPRTIKAIESGIDPFAPQLPKAKPGTLAYRIARLRKRDCHLQPSALRELLAKAWPGVAPIAFETTPAVRCAGVARSYRGRNCLKRHYSVVDALNVMASIHGPP